MRSEGSLLSNSEISMVWTTCGDCGGIRLQIHDGETGFLVGDAPSCARRMVALLEDRELARRIGGAGRESAGRNYLMPRLLRDYLKLASVLLGSKELMLTADP